MKLIKNDTAAKLAPASEDLAAGGKTLAGLRIERDAILADNEADQIEILDQQIGNYERQASVFRERIPLLEARLANEQAAERDRQYKASIDKIASMLPGLSKAAQELESALLAIPRA